MASQHKTGGLLELGQLRQRLISSRGRSHHHQVGLDWARDGT